MMTKVFCAECRKNIIETDYPDYRLILKELDFEVYEVLDRDTILNPPPVAWYEIKSDEYHPTKYYCSRKCLDDDLN